MEALEAENEATENRPETEAQDTVDTQTTINTQAAVQDQVATEMPVENDQTTNETFSEPAYLTAEIDATMANPTPNLNYQSMFKLLALCSNHLELNQMTTEDGVQNVCNMYNYLLENAKAVWEQGLPCDEMVYVLGVLRAKIVSGTGIQAELIRRWAQQAVNASESVI